MNIVNLDGRISQVFLRDFSEQSPHIMSSATKPATSAQSDQLMIFLLHRQLRHQ